SLVTTPSGNHLRTFVMCLNVRHWVESCGILDDETGIQWTVRISFGTSQPKRIPTRRRLHEHSETATARALLAQPHGQVRERLSPSRTPRTRRAKTRGDSDSWCCQSYAAGEGYRAGPAAYRLAGEQRSSLRR